MGLLDRFQKLKWVIEWRRGNKAVEEERWDDAISHLDEAILLNPRDAQCYNLRGRAFGGLGDLDSAIRDFKEARSLAPDDPSVCNNLGTCYLRMGQIDNAVKHYKMALKLDARDVQARTNVGIAYSRKAALASAKTRDRYARLSLTAFDEAIAEDPSYPVPYRERGLLNTMQGRYQDARDDLTQAIELDPSYAQAYYDRGSAYRELGEEQEAIEDFRVARDLDPELVEPPKQLR